MSNFIWKTIWLLANDSGSSNWLFVDGLLILKSPGIYQIDTSDIHNVCDTGRP